MLETLACEALKVVFKTPTKKNFFIDSDLALLCENVTCWYQKRQKWKKQGNDGKLIQMLDF